MKTTRNTQGLARLFAALLLAFCSATPLFAQAFDGSDDSKIYLGYTNVGGRHGVEIGYESTTFFRMAQSSPRYAIRTTKARKSLGFTTFPTSVFISTTISWKC